MAEWARVVDVVGRFCSASVTGLVNVKPVKFKLLLLAAGLFSNRTSLDSTPEVDGIFLHALSSIFFGFNTWTEGPALLKLIEGFEHYQLLVG